ncbi:EF-hand and coiled-coil domain-containing protein 1 isoform X2 [Marmota flaviventris]|uniref:EF-hand and coiled-coil domain-containing protein 1 isoform X2 n=1 Tax=Marmota flaviventris TaxID=93162 RepID=UPI003A86B9FF
MEPAGPSAEEAGAEAGVGDPYRRPARRTQWLLSALAHHYGLDRGVENEIVVLATGLDQYLQEVFHHLDCRGAGRLPRSDFRALCAVLGLRAEGAASGEATGDAIPGDSGDGTSSGDVAAADGDADAQEEARLALRAEPPELTFRQFHARLCGYFGTRAGPRLPRGALSEHIETQIRLRRPRRRRRRQHPTRVQGPDEGGPEGPEGERVARLEEENSSLRELVEDLRAALQSSDARCLALQVGLWKSQAGAHEEGCGRPEAVARELRQAQGALAAAEARAGRLQQGQAEVRRRAEEARQAVLRSLSRVRELEALAQQVPSLQRWVQQLEAELQRYRSQGPQLSTPPQGSPEPGVKRGGPEETGTRATATAPEQGWQSESRTLDEVDEQLFRSVEGQAASDEEEEEEETWRRQKRPPEARAEWPSGCQGGWDERTSRTCQTSSGHFGGTDHACSLGELEAHIERLVGQLQAQGFGGKALGTPVEENVSKRALGQVLLSTLDAWKNPAQEGTPGPSAVLDALHQALAGCELLQRPPPGQASPNPALANPLVLSC